MEDIFHWIRKGDIFQVRIWLNEPENDLNQGDSHQFSPLHWAAKGGHYKITENLLSRGGRVNATNMGDDTPLHLAVAHGHREVVKLLLSQNMDVNFGNEHGNTALHYACFWNEVAIAEDLLDAGALVILQNKYGELPLDKCPGSTGKRLSEHASRSGQDVTRVVPFKDQSWLGLKTRSRDATLSKHKGININELYLHNKIGTSPRGETWIGKWQGNEIVAKILLLSKCTSRIARDFQDEYPKLRIFSHPNILGIIGCCNNPPNLVVISQYLPLGSLFNVLHDTPNKVIIDSSTALSFALDIAKGMSYLHSLDRELPMYVLNSRHVLIDNNEELCAKVHMGDAQYSFQNKSKIFHPAWMSPESMSERYPTNNSISSNMWSYSILLWELFTREIPFAEYSPMEIGMKISLEGLRISLSRGISEHMTKLISICMNEDSCKRPTFDQVMPILLKMKK
ncbi:integrin-linked protein kinase homolog pat-4 [Lepeophtheirus salmonis]|uniref:integrin-linked protein kinase homolog pat-4 n=1 Tax=Lepeophtheirus salmonis TaxID=72036 RepID=UPI001AE97759|nr:integrin-linked protein kinase homolog pat-4-like [Lepeophtheirus salmonis]